MAGLDIAKWRQTNTVFLFVSERPDHLYKPNIVLFRRLLVLHPSSLQIHHPVLHTLLY